VDIKAAFTKPPARFNEATLLSAMEGAGKMVDDEELRAAMAGAAWAPRPPAPRSSRT
jgi:DNA topoisomerase-3